MISGAKTDVLKLRCALAARHVTGVVLLAAALVRLAVGEARATILELAVVTWDVSPPTPRATLSYVGKAARTLGREVKALADGTPAATDYEETGSLRRFRRRFPTPREVRLISDERVRHLQRRIIRAVFGRRFGIGVEEEHLDVLSAYSSVSWLARNLSAAAGLGAQPPRNAGARHRMQVVLPVLVGILALHKQYLTLDAGGAGDARAGGLITSEVYPHTITVETLRQKIDAHEKRKRHKRMEVRTAGLSLRLERHLDAVALLHGNAAGVQGGGPGVGSRRAARALSRLERIRI